MTTTMHHSRPRVETPTLEDRPSTSGICTTCGFWPCQCADLAWADALTILTDPDDEVLAATRTDMLTTYAQLVLDTALDDAALDAISDMADIGLIRPEDLTLPAPAAQLLGTATAWIGDDIERDDDQHDYERDETDNLLLAQLLPAANTRPPLPTRPPNPGRHDRAGEDTSPARPHPHLTPTTTVTPATAPRADSLCHCGNSVDGTVCNSCGCGLNTRQCDR